MLRHYARSVRTLPKPAKVLAASCQASRNLAVVIGGTILQSSDVLWIAGGQVTSVFFAIPDLPEVGTEHVVEVRKGSAAVVPSKDKMPSIISG